MEKTLSFWIERFAQETQAQGGYHTHTLTAYLSDLRRGAQLLAQRLGHEPTPQELSPEHILWLLETDAQAGLRRSTLLRRMASWRAFERFLLLQQAITAPFLPDREALNQVWKDTDAPNHAPCLTTEDLERLWNTLLADSGRHARRDLALIALITEWGFSSQTIISLRLSDVDLEQRLVRIYSPIQGPIEFPLRASYEPLRRYLRYGRPEFNPDPHEDALFISQLGRRLSRQSLWQLVKNWGRAAGLSIPLTPRTLRHTAAYRMLKEGLPTSIIGLALEHTN
ncbi:hypothetical protein D6833_14010, partial [Candidatus Parcubacteria bacterium]